MLAKFTLKNLRRFLNSCHPASSRQWEFLKSLSFSSSFHLPQRGCTAIQKWAFDKLFKHALRSSSPGAKIRLLLRKENMHLVDMKETKDERASRLLPVMEGFALKFNDRISAAPLKVRKGQHLDVDGILARSLPNSGAFPNIKTRILR